MTTYQIDFQSVDEDVSAFTFFEAAEPMDAEIVLCDVVERRLANNLRGVHSLRDSTGKILVTYSHARNSNCP